MKIRLKKRRLQKDWKRILQDGSSAEDQSAVAKHNAAGSVRRYEKPTDPVGVDEWEALK